MTAERGERVSFTLPNDGVLHDDDSSHRREVLRRLRARQSVSCEPGMEGKLVMKGEHAGKSIAVFTSGGDAQGSHVCDLDLVQLPVLA